MLLACGVPTVVLRAAVIIGSGSASFEMLRYLTERLPAMITPRWVDTRIQPIAIRDVLRYLVAAAGLPAEVSRSFDIGGPDVLTYRDMMQHYARVAGLRRRLIVQVPVLTPSLSGHWVGLVTPVPTRSPGRWSTRCASRWSPPSTTSPSTSRTRPRACSGSTLGRPRAAAHPGRRGRHPLVLGVGAGRPQRPAAHRPGLGRRQPLPGPAAAQRRRLPRRAVAGRRGHRRRPRLVLVPARLAGARPARPDRRRRRPAPRAARPGPRLRRRDHRLLAGRGARPRRAAAAPGRDAAAGPGLARASASRPTRPRPAARHTCSARCSTPAACSGHAYWWAVAPFHGIVFGGMARNIATAAEAHDPSTHGPHQPPADNPAQANSVHPCRGGGAGRGAASRSRGPRPGRRSGRGSRAARGRPRAAATARARSVVESGELLDVPPDVRASRVVATRLQHHVVRPVEPRVGAGARRPTASSSCCSRRRRRPAGRRSAARPPPVDVQRLAQEVRDDQPRPVVHPALPGELPHAGVHDRVAGPALLPGLELLGAAVPAVAARAVVLGGRPAAGPRAAGRRSRARPPAGRTPRRRGCPAPPARRTSSSADTAAEMQVRRQPAGVVVAERVVVVLVRRQAGPQPPGHPGPPSVSPPGTTSGEAHRRQRCRRPAAGRGPARPAGDSDRGDRASPGSDSPLPAAEVRREDRHMVLAGGGDSPRRDDEQRPVVHDGLRRRRAGGSEPLHAAREYR